MHESKPRLLATYQAYNKIFKDRLTPIIEAEWLSSILAKRNTEEERALKVPQVPINFRNKAVKRMLEAEPPEVHEQVEAWRQARRAPIEDIEYIEAETMEETVNFSKADEYQK